MIELNRMVEYLDSYLRVGEVPDAPGAFNGLQLERAGPVERVAAAVDASESAIEAAVDAGADLLLVHHGLFWSGGAPLTGRRYRKVKKAMDGGLAVYSAHIPLDVHPDVGNNVRLARALGVELAGEFGAYKGIELGVWGRLDVSASELASRLESLLGGPVRFIAGGPRQVGTVGVITGAAGEMIDDGLELGLDAFVTGEGRHHSYFDAVEGGINVYYGGHYATETWGVRALAEHLAERFDLTWTFLDQPTGM